MSNTVLKSEESEQVLLEGMPLEALPYPSYLAKNDSCYTLVWGNRLFYEMAGCTAGELKTTGRNRLDALWEEDALNILENLTDGDAFTPLSFRHKFKTSGGYERTLSTRGIRLQRGQEALFFCMSTDITETVEMEYDCFLFRELGRFAAEDNDIGVFEYDPVARSARALIPRSVFACIATESDIYPDFPEIAIRRNLIHPRDLSSFRRAFEEDMRAGNKSVRELRICTDGEAYEWHRLSMSVKQRQDGPGLYALGVLENIEQQKAAAVNYLNETQFFQALLAEKDAYAQVDVTEDRITKTGGIWNIYNEIIHKVTFSDLFGEFVQKVVHPEDRAHYAEVMRRDNFIHSLENGVTRLGCEFRRILEQNKMVWMKLSVNLFLDPLTHHTLALLCIKNIDKKKRQELALLHNSARDSLTNIFHKKMAENAIRDCLKKFPSGRAGAFMILDLDDFKGINDRFGHEIGDQVLIRFVDILKNAIGRNDILGRFGGDEFIIFVRNMTSQQQVTDMMEQIYERIRQESDPPISCSIGVSVAHGGVPYELLFRQADAALYTAKSSGKSRYAYYQGESLDAAKAGTPRERTKEYGLESGLSIGLPGDEYEEQVTFEDLLSEQGDISYLVEPDTFALLDGNKSFYDRIGKTESECLGMKCYEAIHKRQTPCPFCSKANWSTDKFYMWKNYNEALEQEFLIKNKLVQWRGREALLAISVDISNNKSIVDSIDNSAEESRRLLGGIQQMSSAPDLAASVHCALETIGGFFRSESVRYWERREGGAFHECTAVWSKNGKGKTSVKRLSAVNAWLTDRKWLQPIMIENPEAILQESYGMYQFMAENKIANQRWGQIREDGEKTSYISVDNMSTNFQNVAFLESFSVFMAEELKKRHRLEEIQHPNRKNGKG